MAIKKDSENRFIIESPNGNTGGQEIIQYVETPKNLIKETIANAITKGVDKSIVESNIRKIINQSLNGCPNDLKSQIRRALVIFAQKEYFTLDHNAKVIAKNFKNRLYNETGYEIPKTQNPIAALTDVNFRNEITDASKGLPVIRDYQRMYREQIRALSVATPKLNKNGKPIPIRLSVETELRYKANKEDLDEAMASDKKLFWISSHADASPRCSPYQGKLYSNDKSLCGKTIDGNKVEALTLDEVCALNGGNSIICGYNCRHYIIEYTKGSKAPKGYDSKKIQKEYAIDQKQRNYEQRIRQLKEEQRLASSIGDKARAKNLSARWHKLEKEYQVFSLQNNRAFYDWRTTVVRKNSKLDENIIVVPINDTILKQNDVSSNKGDALMGVDLESENYFLEISEIYSDFDLSDGKKFNMEYDVLSKHQNSIANEDTFFINSVGKFEELKRRPSRKPDYVSYTRDGKISSEYWYDKDGVIRGSKHWGLNIASCDWKLGKSLKDVASFGNSSKQYGKCSWENFKYKDPFIITTDGVKNVGFENIVKVLGKTHILYKIDGNYYYRPSYLFLPNDQRNNGVYYKIDSKDDWDKISPEEFEKAKIISDIMDARQKERQKIIEEKKLQKKIEKIAKEKELQKQIEDIKNGNGKYLYSFSTYRDGQCYAIKEDDNYVYAITEDGEEKRFIKALITMKYYKD